MTEKLDWDLGIKLQINYAYTLDSEVADIKVSKRQHVGGSDSQLIVWSLEVITNVLSPILFTLALHEEISPRSIIMHSKNNSNHEC